MTVHLTDKVQRSFSRSFHTYHDAANQQAWVAERLVDELHRLGAPNQYRAGFELGCGTGHLSRLLRAQFSVDHLSLNDIAPQARQTAHTVDARFVEGDARQVSWPAHIDLLVSASMIQWMENPADLLRKAAKALAPGGWLAISGFGPKQYQELRQIGSAAQAPGLCGADEMRAAIEDVLIVKSAGESLRPSYFATPRDVLRHLRNTGVNGRAQRAWTKSTLAWFEQDYWTEFGDGQGVPLTYHPVWIIAQKREG